MNTEVITKTCKEMSKTAIVSNMSVVRAEVIAKRTESVACGITKSALISELKAKMKEGFAHFVFVKKNGELREAWGTISSELAMATTTGTGMSRENYATCAYFDVIKGAWRSFRWETLIQVL